MAVHSSFQLPATPPDKQPGWIKRAKRAIPQPVRDALKPVVRKIYPDALSPKPWDLSVCDRPIGNAYTIHADGRELKFFFLTGCWKSGTHWVANVLNLHPAISIKGEHHFEEVIQCKHGLTDATWFMGHRTRLRTVAFDALDNVVRRMMYYSTRDKPQATFIGDHTPRLLVPVLNSAPHLHLVRDGRDVVVSWAYHWLRVKEVNTFLPQFRHLARKWVPLFEQEPDRFRDPSIGLLGDDEWFRHACRGWARYIRHDSMALPQLRKRGMNILDLRYEDLHRNFDTELGRLYRFFGLDPAAAEAPSEATKTLPGFTKVDSKSHYRKGQIGDWQNHFDERLTRIFKEEAGESLITAGYEKNLGW